MKHRHMHMYSTCTWSVNTVVHEKSCPWLRTRRSAHSAQWANGAAQ
ncbi:hypothetical protein GBAR_LOCUS10693 [Geodia barretti]|uniref:Uncharacterized protein n=1 Tax=Geodia barretti TaxID=519541 RepID=A0AA35RTY0_GEOBA|nr:hypothetical protein GBAR_LOCUS10693 [Geodia barretti]